MDNLNLPPFYVGQRVVALTTCSTGFREKGKEYIIKGINQCCKCLKWHVNIGEIYRTSCNECYNCDYIFPGVDCYWWHRAAAFAPITDNFQSITLAEVIDREVPLVSVN